MRCFVLLLLLFLLPVAGGCALSDIVFGALSDHYSEGGASFQEKRYHHDRQMEAWNAYDRYGDAR